MKRLITERDLLDGRVAGPIVLDDRTLLTPAARDRAALMGLVVIEADARGQVPPVVAVAGSECSRHAHAHGGSGCSRCGSGAPAGGPALPGGLADGLYLLRIEGGRAVCVQPAAGPGLLPRSTAQRADSVSAAAFAPPARPSPAVSAARPGKEV